MVRATGLLTVSPHFSYLKNMLNWKTQRCFALDLDGVVYQGEELLPGVLEAIAEFQKAGKQLVYLTNNSSRTQAAVFEKLRHLGVPCTLNEVINSAHAAALRVRDEKLDGGRGVFVVGADGLREEIRGAGLTLASADDCGALVIGMDFKFNYDSLVQAMRAALRGVPMIACNRDANFPGEGGLIFPGCGAIVGAIEGCAAREVDAIAGKPHPFMLETVTARFGLRAQDAIIFGDTLESDIALGEQAGIPSVLIGAALGSASGSALAMAPTSGMASAPTSSAGRAPPKPTYLARGLLDFWQSKPNAG